MVEMAAFLHSLRHMKVSILTESIENPYEDIVLNSNFLVVLQEKEF